MIKLKSLVAAEDLNGFMDEGTELLGELRFRNVLRIDGRLKGLEGDLCQAPHWGYLLQGEVTVTYADATEEVIRGGDLFYWPPGHTVRVGQDAEVILFSPQDEHGKVIDHMRGRMVG